MIVTQNSGQRRQPGLSGSVRKSLLTGHRPCGSAKLPANAFYVRDEPGWRMPCSMAVAIIVLAYAPRDGEPSAIRSTLRAT